MSILGLDALGRLALGQLPKSSKVILPALAGSFAVTGTSIALNVKELAAGSAYAITGVSVSFTPLLAGSYALAGTSIALAVTGPAATASYAVSGVATIEAILEADAAGSFALTGVAASLPVRFAANAGALAVTGIAAPFAVSTPASAGSYGTGGVAAPFSIGLPANPGGYVLAGVAEADAILWPDSAGSYAVTGTGVPIGPALLAASGSFAITANQKLVPLGGAGMMLGAGALGQITTTINTNFATTFAINEPAPGASSTFISGANLLLRTGGDADQVYGGIGHYLVELENARQLARITRKTPAPIDRTTAPRFAPVGRPPVATPAPVTNLQAAQNQRMGAQQAAAAQAATIKRRRQEEELILLAS